MKSLWLILGVVAGAVVVFLVFGRRPSTTAPSPTNQAATGQPVTPTVPVMQPVHSGNATADVLTGIGNLAGGLGGLARELGIKF